MKISLSPSSSALPKPRHHHHVPSRHMVAEHSKGRLVRNRVGCVSPAIFFASHARRGVRRGLGTSRRRVVAWNAFQCTGEECEAGGFTSHHWRTIAKILTEFERWTMV